MAVAKPKVHTQLREPAATPDPITEQRVHDRTDAAAINHEGRKLPSLCGRTGRDRGGGVHKHHLEQEKGERCRIVAGVLKQKSLPSKQPEEVSAQRHAKLVV